MENSKKYWLHRISNEWEVSYTLLEKGYISYGWSDFAHNEEILEAARKDDEREFERIYSTKEKTKYRSRWNLWYFAQFKKDDLVLVPLFDGNFSIYEVVTPAVSIKHLESEIGEFDDKNEQPIVWDNGLLKRQNKTIDIGFVIKVRKIRLELDRKEYADNALTSRMKMRQSNGDISDLAYNVDSVIKLEGPINFYENALEDGAKSLLNRINSDLDDRKMEKLVKEYMNKIGANNTYIPPKNEIGKKDYADADVVAIFDTLRIAVLIQVKCHQGITSSWAVEQIMKYKEQLEDKSSDLTHELEYESTNIMWVISSGEDFDEKAKLLAKENNVRLINGIEFARMIINAGLSELDVL